jgi:hypothetical protein
VCYGVAPLTTIWPGRLPLAHAKQIPRTTAAVAREFVRDMKADFAARTASRKTRSQHTKPGRSTKHLGPERQEAARDRREGDVPADEGSDGSQTETVTERNAGTAGASCTAMPCLRPARRARGCGSYTTTDMTNRCLCFVWCREQLAAWWTLVASRNPQSWELSLVRPPG